MITKQLVETIKHNGILASAGELKKLFTKAVEAEEKNIELQQKLTDMAVQLANAESKCRELAGENEKQNTHSEALAVDNAALREVVERMVNQFAMSGISPEEKSINPAKSLMFDAKSALFMPATDAFLAEVRAQGVTEYASKRGFSFQHGSIHAHFGNGDVMVGSVTFENGDAGINFAPVREKTGGVGTSYEWTNGKTTEQVDSVFTIASSNSEGLEVIRDKLSEAIAQLRKGAAL